MTSAKHALARVRAPEEAAAEDRAWVVMRTAYPEIAPAPRRRPHRRLAQALIVAAVLAAVVLSSAVASVKLFTHAARTVIKPIPAVSTLPAAGSLLISSAAGTWTLAARGTIRRLGGYEQATWSPKGEYVAVAGRDQLRAVDPRGRVMWTLHRPAVHDPRWYASNGYRLAYLSGRQLRVVAGDGTEDRLLAPAVDRIAPAWRPDHPYELAYVTTRARLIIQDADSRKIFGQAAAPRSLKTLAWSSDGTRLLALARQAAVIYAPAAAEVARIRGPMVDAALSPDGRTLALIRGSDVILEPVAAGGLRSRRVLSEAGLRQVLWSPDGHWLLVSWPAADEWLFVQVSGPPRIAAYSRVREQFQGFPQLEGWCCTINGTS